MWMKQQTDTRGYGEEEGEEEDEEITTGDRRMACVWSCMELGVCGGRRKK